MNKLIYAPLLFLLIIAIFYLSYLSTDISASPYDETQSGFNGSSSLNETDTTYSQDSYNINFIVEMGIYSLIVIAVGCAIIALVGLNIVGSGLTDESVKIIYQTTVHYIIWGVISTFGGFSALQLMPYGFGLLLYFIITLVYTVGIIQSISGA